MNVVFPCPHCARPGKADLTSPSEWQCAGCGYRLVLEPPTPDLPTCAICGNHEFYKKKDFPHRLGMAILIGACVLSVITHLLYLQMWTWTILIGSAAFDGLLYLWVGDAIVCYRCNANFRNVKTAKSFPPFEIVIGERYRQDRMRRE